MDPKSSTRAALVEADGRERPPHPRGPLGQLWAGHGIHGYQVTWSHEGVSRRLGVVRAAREPLPAGVERWAFHGEVGGAFLRACARGEPGTMSWEPLRAPIMAEAGDVNWSLTRRIEPERATSAIVGDVLFVCEQAPELVACLAIRFATDGDELVLKTLKWWANRLEEDGTLCPTVGEAATTYLGRQAYAYDGELWTWPEQDVNLRFARLKAP